MSKVLATESRSRKRPTVRGGRPPRERAGEVDERILDAARDVFLERGLAGASIDEIAERACAGKPTIYARFPGKEALFTAVMTRNVAANLAQFSGPAPSGATIEERLVNAATSGLRWALGGVTIDLMRLGIAESRRFPELASNVHQMARHRAEETVARLVREAAQADTYATLPAFSPDRLAETTRFFIDLVIFPLMIRALFGEKTTELRGEIESHVAESVAFFLAACRQERVK
jgi:AcrR family transcriptional regulator